MADDDRAPYTLIRDLPATERPRERLRDAGAVSLSNSELLAILLRTGTPREDVLHVAALLLRDRGGLRGLAATDLAYWDPSQQTWVVEPGPVELLVGRSSADADLTLRQTVAVGR